ncbi:MULTISPECIES: nuclear transport factor 2 family protein [unclassified Streptomyces]|uniref:nuclear transport factor 2 family protein n=1 Tax=unclassified Streptomyces TaxID=2593676 RepID=UPI000DC7DF19|nr:MULTISPECIES: nuclear transport factor 2 family protein [unclassified Streptomyces]AWZ07623.1 nuclear transport factor 2 family protein [Streptomyces sp. ICC4]AWZ16711.1 nuclear transport factor 2 family protein [Streptomyces sp. ICC1]
MTVEIDELTDPAVRAFVGAVNAGVRREFTATLTPDATMSDDGTERDLAEWTEKEIFGAGGHMDVETQTPDGLGLVARFRNDTWGEMRTAWRFRVEGGKVSRFETGQA